MKNRDGEAGPNEDKEAQVAWSQRRQDVAMVLWPSFLAAAVATLLCFAFLDPAALGVERMTGYGIGFFFFWIVAAVSSLITLYLARTAHREP